MSNFFIKQFDISESTIFVKSQSDFGTPDSAGAILLENNKTYFILGNITLDSVYLVCATNNCIIGSSSENSTLTFTNLPSGEAAIQSAYTIVLRDLAITADLALNIDGDGTIAMDWQGVNFVDCPSIGTIKDFNNFVFERGAFINSSGMVFDGTSNTIAFSTSLFSGDSGTIISLVSTCTINRRFRIIYSSFIVLGIGIDVDASATIPTESYILDSCNFSGDGTYISGIDHTSNDTLFVNNKGITNTAVNGQLYMQSNATATTISNTTDFVKVAGTTTNSSDNAKYTGTNNRLTNNATIVRKFFITASLSFSSGNNNVCEFGFFDSKLNAIRTPSRTLTTANSSGRAENVDIHCVVSHSDGDYLEVWCKNTSSATNITVTDMNFVIVEI